MNSILSLGLYKIQNFISVVVALFIFFAGYAIAREAQSAAKSAPKISVSVVILLSAGGLAIYFFGVYATRVGRRTESPTLPGCEGHPDGAHVGCFSVAQRAQSVRGKVQYQSHWIGGRRYRSYDGRKVGP
jgi:Co/Zn/Cd efflux system component